MLRGRVSSEVVKFRPPFAYSTATHKSDLHKFAIIFSAAAAHLRVDDAGIKTTVLLMGSTKMVWGPQCRSES